MVMICSPILREGETQSGTPILIVSLHHPPYPTLKYSLTPHYTGSLTSTRRRLLRGSARYGRVEI